MLLKNIIFFVLLRLSLWITDHLHWSHIHWESQRRDCEAGMSVYSCCWWFWASGHWVEPTALRQPERRESGEYLITITLSKVWERMSLQRKAYLMSHYSKASGRFSFDFVPFAPLPLFLSQVLVFRKNKLTKLVWLPMLSEAEQ